MSDSVQNARAMLTLFAKSPWRDLYVRTTDGELFFAKPDGATNPMRAAPPAAAETIQTTIRAPHLASVVSVQPKGTTIMAGASVVVLELLGEAFDVISPAAGTVASIAATPGDLVEFDQPLVSLAD